MDTNDALALFDLATGTNLNDKKKKVVSKTDKVNNKKVVGPKGGKGHKTGEKDKEGNDIIQRDSGGYYTVLDKKTGKQKRVNSPNEHGNTLNDKPSECYTLKCKKTGKTKKIGETTHGESKYGKGKQKRYTEDYLREKGVKYKQTDTGTKKDMYKKQIEDLKEYKNKEGKYPDLNKNGR
jgi:hypothetical protein